MNQTNEAGTVERPKHPDTNPHDPSNPDQQPEPLPLPPDGEPQPAPIREPDEPLPATDPLPIDPPRIAK